MPARLGRATLGRVPAASRRRTAPEGLRPGIVHLGLGAFHRAHQAVYTEDAVAAAGGDWGITAVAPRSRTVHDPLAAQDRLFTVTSLSDAAESARVVGVHAGVLHAPSDPLAVVARIADAATRVVTLTVTEKAYRLDPASGRLHRGDPDLVADLRGGRPPVTVPGMLVRGLAARARGSGPPLTVLTCDNLPSNGHVVAGLVAEALTLLPAGERERARDWVSSSVAFPCTMVDRIVPAPSAATRDRALRLLGVADGVAVDAEPFSQWVVEDRFPAGRPAWEQAGAILTADVTPWEKLKLRVLNGAHSTLAYLGAVAGQETVAEALELPGMREFLMRLLVEDVAPTLEPPPGVDLDSYAKSVLERFSNQAIVYRTLQVAMDGSQKLPQRLVHTVTDRLRAGHAPRWAALALAAWIRFVQGRGDTGTDLPLDDPLAPRLRAAAAATAGNPAAAAESFLGFPEIFGPEVREHREFTSTVAAWLRTLESHGVTATLASLRSEA